MKVKSFFITLFVFTVLLPGVPLFAGGKAAVVSEPGSSQEPEGQGADVPDPDGEQPRPQDPLPVPD
jgi:hypothetical protein